MPMNRTHILKSWPKMFDAFISGAKRHDVRKVTDRSFEVGDTIVFREFDPRSNEFTGRECKAEVTYITSSSVPCPFFDSAIADDFCILSVNRVAS
jgi:hypothetical protein